MEALLAAVISLLVYFGLDISMTALSYFGSAVLMVNVVLAVSIHGLNKDIESKRFSNAFLNRIYYDIHSDIKLSNILSKYNLSKFILTAYILSTVIWYTHPIGLFFIFINLITIFSYLLYFSNTYYEDLSKGLGRD